MNDRQTIPEVRKLLAQARPELKPEWQQEARAAVVEAQARRQQGRSPRRFRRLVYALGAVAVGLLLYRPAVDLVAPPSPLVTVTAVRGAVTGRGGHALHLGDRLRPGAVVRTGAGGRVTLFTRHGTEVTLNARSELRLHRDGRGAELRRGELYCRNRAHELAQVRTPAGRIVLLGTEFDAAVKDVHTTAVTVLEGKVQLANRRGTAIVPAGHRALLTVAQLPDEGSPTTSAADLAWYDGRFDVVSAQGEIAYTVVREPSAILEVWAMNADGTGKHLVKSYLGGYGREAGQWLADSSWIGVSTEHTFLFMQMRGASWVLNVDTGEELRVNLPRRFQAPMDNPPSPDGRYLAFMGVDQTAANREEWRYGLFVYDLQDDSLRQLYQGPIAGHYIAWAPDSRHLLVPLGERYHVPAPPLALIAVDTGEVQDLGVSGTDPSFSPDGTQIAYCGDFPTEGSYAFNDGTPDHSSVFVFDLTTGVERRISAQGASGHRPVWSPDGTRVAYWQAEKRTGDPWGFSLHVAPADGSGPVEVYRSQAGGWPHRLAWVPSGDALYTVTQASVESGSGGVLVIAADGSGVLADLGGNAEDSRLTRQQQIEFEAACKELTSPTAQACLHVEGDRMQGRLREARTALGNFADLATGLLWTAPHLNFSGPDLVSYAEAATAEAARPDEEVLAEVCQYRIRWLAEHLIAEASSSGEWPSQDWFLAHTRGPLRPDSLSPDNLSPDIFFRCPVGDEEGADHPIAYTYTPPPTGQDPAIGDVIASCPVHHYRLVWTKERQDMLAAARAQRAEGE